MIPLRQHVVRGRDPRTSWPTAEDCPRLRPGAGPGQARKPGNDEEGAYAPERVAAEVKRVVAEAWRLRVRDLEGGEIDRKTVRARHVAMFMIYEMTAMSRAAIAAAFRRRDAKSVGDACRSIGAAIEEDPALQTAIGALWELVTDALPGYAVPGRPGPGRPAHDHGEFVRPQPPPGQVKERRCLKCGEAFLSRGPGNRICGTCSPMLARVSHLMEGVSW